LVEFVGELVVPSRIPQGVDMVAVEFFQIKKREAGEAEVILGRFVACLD